jgi:thymidylate synthase (FAD)
MGNDLAVVQAARVSTLKDSKGEESDKKLINYLMKNGHTSPFEMVELKFRIKCPLIVARQILRHRTANVNETSRRYTSEQVDFYIPEFFRKQAEDNKQASTEDKIEILYVDDQEIPVSKWVSDLCEDLLDKYEWLLSLGVAREQARMILPQNMNTIFIFKIDLHNLLHFLEVRSTDHAQWETRQFAFAMMELTKEVAPISYTSWEKYIKNRRMNE